MGKITIHVIPYGLYFLTMLSFGMCICLIGACDVINKAVEDRIDKVTMCEKVNLTIEGNKLTIENHNNSFVTIIIKNNGEEEEDHFVMDISTIPYNYPIIQTQLVGVWRYDMGDPTKYITQWCRNQFYYP